jgi:Effector Associated Constant Component 1
VPLLLTFEVDDETGRDVGLLYQHLHDDPRIRGRGDLNIVPGAPDPEHLGLGASLLELYCELQPSIVPLTAVIAAWTAARYRRAPRDRSGEPKPVTLVIRRASGHDAEADAEVTVTLTGELETGQVGELLARLGLSGPGRAETDPEADTDTEAGDGKAS